MKKMKNLFKFPTIALVAFALTFTSCSDDNDEPDPNVPSVESVFTAGLPTSVNGASLTTNEKGQVTKIEDGYEVVTFEYGDFSPNRAASYSVLMKIRDKEYPGDDSDIYMQLNKQGFVAHALQIYEDAENGTDTWDFEYNNDGQLTKLKRSEGDDEFVITYTNGDITKVVQTIENNFYDEISIYYTNSEYTTPIANKGCVMMFDDFFGIDMDEMGITYYAGLLGKATKNLPMKITENENEGTLSDYPFYWEFNSDNLPTKFWGDNYGWDAAVTFSWK